MSEEPGSRLHRVLGVRAAVIVGLGAMLGTGLFAAWTPAWHLAGDWLLAALAVAAAVAAMNATSTATLARILPESGGAYAYGRSFIGRPAGVVAGYAFVVGKAASAGAAGLTIGAYVWPQQARPVGLVAIAIALAFDLRGLVKSARVTLALVVAVLASVGALAATWAWHGAGPGVVMAPQASPITVIAAAGLLFVAFAGYARITVLGEEVRNPARTIPRAMAVSFVIVIVVYVIAAVVVLQAVASGVTLGSAPLESIAQSLGAPALEWLMRVAAAAAAGAVLLSLLAGIGRTLFAMGDRGDAPRLLAAVSSRGVPHRAEIAAALFASAVVCVWCIG